MASDTQKHSTQIHMQKYLPKNIKQKNADCKVKLSPKNLPIAGKGGTRCKLHIYMKTYHLLKRE